LKRRWRLIAIVLAIYVIGLLALLWFASGRQTEPFMYQNY
jgi:hypothetical protein